MINLKLSKRTEINDIENIINEKNKGDKKTQLLKLKNKIVSRYGTHIAIELLNRLAKDSYTLDEKTALQSLYFSKTKTAREITKEILDNLDANHSNVCLYCGIGEIDQIDHFLPKEHFPEFSILHKNLIPICGKCNEIKGSKIPGDNGIDFLQVIFDILPIENYLICKITYKNKIPEVTFEIEDKFKDNIVNIHFNSLGLSKRLEKKATQYFLQIKALKNEFGLKYAEDELERNLKNTKFYFNDFFWKTELISEMLSTDFLNEIE
ncbi:hypothetical protein [uncultured Tenacibaculum sp.]|uniref:HNH endonuclease n=1 Tax=uncultured Tenacibaculum sp. TaxID=174713 RepID=UPI00263414F4|nr:hypothetical protein [uncultured Tenacibaculum sp.]